MNFSDLKLVSCNSCNDWDEFIDKSPDGNIFSTSQYLNNYEGKILKIFFKNKEEILAAAILVNSSKAPRAISTILLFASSFRSCLKNPTRTSFALLIVPESRW